MIWEMFLLLRHSTSLKHNLTNIEEDTLIIVDGLLLGIMKPT